MEKKKKIAIVAASLLVVCGVGASAAVAMANAEPSEATVEEVAVEETVMPTVDGISADSLSLVTNGEATANLNAAVTGTDTDTVVFWYSVSNESISVDTEGNVTAIEKTNVAPFVTVMAKYDANGDGVADEDDTTLESLKVAVSVSTVLENIIVEATATDLVAYPYTGVTGEDSVATLIVTANPTGAAATGVTYVSSDEAVATVSADGTVTAKAAGTVAITATCAEGFSAECTITVTRADSDVQAQADAEAAAAKAAAEAAAAQAAAEAAAAAESQAADAAAAAEAQAAADAAAAASSSSSSSSSSSTDSSSGNTLEIIGYTSNGGEIWSGTSGQTASCQGDLGTFGE